jgi:purine nucleosidase
MPTMRASFKNVAAVVTGLLISAGVSAWGASTTASTTAPAPSTAPASPATGRQPRLVIIDQDTFGPGGTNLQSILMLLQAPDVKVLGITVVSGDGWRDENVRHVLRLLEIAGRTDVPVYAGAEQPLLNSAARTAIWEKSYGALVYKGAWTAAGDTVGAPQGTVRHADPALVPDLAEGNPVLTVQSRNAVDFMIDAVHRYPGQVTIWAGGPLTDLALASRIDPGFAGAARELVFMGGSFNPRPNGSIFSAEYQDNPRREFNIRWDPEAASMVLHEPWRHITEIPVDPTTTTFFSDSLFKQLERGHARFDSYLFKYRQNLPMWDELAAAAWLDPTLVTSSVVEAVDVDTSFTAGYGNMLSWPLGHGPGLGEQNVMIVQGVDVTRFERLTLDLLTGSASNSK